jgi:hypothetical protein
MLLTAGWLWKYISSCHNIYDLPLLLSYYCANSYKQTPFWHTQLFSTVHLLPLHPPLSLHNINTDCHKQDGNW